MFGRASSRRCSGVLFSLLFVEFMPRSIEAARYGQLKSTSHIVSVQAIFTGIDRYAKLILLPLPQLYHEETPEHTVCRFRNLLLHRGQLIYAYDGTPIVQLPHPVHKKVWHALSRPCPQVAARQSCHRYGSIIIGMRRTVHFWKLNFCPSVRLERWSRTCPGKMSTMSALPGDHGLRTSTIRYMA